jgi:hypothetical protein
MKQTSIVRWSPGITRKETYIVGKKYMFVFSELLRTCLNFAIKNSSLQESIFSRREKIFFAGIAGLRFILFI